MFTIEMQNNEILTLSISMFSSFKCKSEQNYLMDYNWMYTYFIKAHDELISSRLKNYN